MAYSAITVSAIITQIKKESRIEGSDNLDVMILGILNELLLEETQNHRYGEMLVLNHSLTLVTAQETYTLPDNFANIRLIRYKFANGYTITLQKRTEYIQERTTGNPKFFDIADNVIYVFPYDRVLDTDSLLVDYYKNPDQLANDTTAFPIQRLVGAIKQKAIQRVLIYNRDLAAAQVFRGEGAEDTERVQPG
jgi:hypothetical protein